LLLPPSSFHAAAQPDFVSQKSQLEEFVTSRGHICDFYPKYHCELNFIEQYWGHPSIVIVQQLGPQTLGKWLASLDDVPLTLLQIRRFVSIFFIL
jgi:hypothetical protein